MYKNYYNKFISLLGSPNDKEKLIEYIKFVLDNAVHDCDQSYCELHHIIPRSITTNKDVFLLSYENHCTAHCILFEAYSINKFQYPLNFMLSPRLKALKESIDYKNKLSNIRKEEWRDLKANKEKYDSWRQKRSASQKKLMSNKTHVKDISLKIKEYWKLLKEDEDAYNNYIKSLKSSFTDKRKKHMSLKMDEFYSKDSNRLKKSIEAKNRYNSMSEDDRLKFKKTMSEVNSRESKKLAAGKSIKKLWDTPEFRNKMSKRKSRKVLKYKMINKDGMIIYHDGLNSLANKYNLNLSLLRKFMNTGKFIKSHMKNEKTLNTINWKITSYEA